MNFGYYSGSSEYYYTLHWWVNSQSVANNTTNIGYEIYTSWASNRHIYVYGASCSIAGTTIWNGETGNSYGGTKVSSSMTIYHNPDGTRSISSWGYATIYGASNYKENSGGPWALTTIARKAEISSAPNFNDEANPKITYTNPAGSNVSSLQACISLTGARDDIVYRDINKTGTLAYTFNLADAERTVLRNACPSSNSLTIYFFIKTVIGSNTFYSNVSKTMTIVNGNPTFSNFTYRDTNSAVTNITGNNQILVKGMSTLQVQIPQANKMTAIKSATAKNYVTTIDTNNVSTNYASTALTIDVGTVNNSGTKDLTVRAYDSRNNSTAVTKNVTVYDYDKPVVNASAVRLNNWENTTYINVSGTFSKLTINNQEKNTIKGITYRYKEENGSFNSWTNIPFSINNNTYSCTQRIISLDNKKSYIIEIKAQDYLGETIVTKTVGIGEAIFFISSNKNCCLYKGQEMLDYEVVEQWEE